jgi:hypothetical protein
MNLMKANLDTLKINFLKSVLNLLQSDLSLISFLAPIILYKP